MKFPLLTSFICNVYQYSHSADCVVYIEGLFSTSLFSFHVTFCIYCLYCTNFDTWEVEILHPLKLLARLFSFILPNMLTVFIVVIRSPVTLYRVGFYLIVAK